MRASLSVFLILICSLVLCSNLFADDPDQYTKLLIHSDSTDGSILFEDASGSPHTVTAYGNVNHSIAAQKFGATSIYFDGSGDYLSVPDSSDWDFGTENFTVEFWIYPTATTLSGVRLILGTYIPGQYKGWTIGIVNGALAFIADTNGWSSWDINISDPAGLVANTWYHCAVVRNGDEWSLFKNGSKVAGATVAGALFPSHAPLEIGESYLYYQFAGYLDEVHISKGIARYGENTCGEGGCAPEGTSVGGTISTDTTWTLDGSPYTVTSSIIIQGTDGADGITTLTIEPGVTVKFENAQSLSVGAVSGASGALVAQGTAADPIVFTSNQENPAPGDWQGIYLYDTADDATTRLEHCSVQYSGGGDGALYIWSAAPTVSATTIENSGQYDLYYRGAPGGLVTGCTLHSGVYLMNANTVQFTGNTFHYNNAYPVKTYAAYVHGFVNGNTFADLDSASALWVDSGNVIEDATWTGAIPIYLNNAVIVQGTDGADGITTLTIEPGAELRFAAGRSLHIGYISGAPGALVAQGTAAAPIVFTSNQENPAPGDWLGIYFNDTADDTTTLLEHCRVEYAGNVNGTIYINNASPVFRHVTVQNSAYSDFYYANTVGGEMSDCTLNSGISLLADSSVVFTGNTFKQNNTYPIKTYADLVSGLVNGNTFANLDAASVLWVDSGNVIEDATWTAAIPIYLNNAVIVQGTDGADGITTLTIEPGAELRFAAGRSLQVGYAYGAPGALVAQGTESNPIVFTSNQANPAPGDWQGIYFYDTAADATTKLEHCSVRYSGGGGGALYIYSAAPTVSATTIENSGQYDLYYRGTPGGLVTGCTLHSGVYLLDANTVQFTGNTFHYNNDFPIKTYAAKVHGLVNGNIFADLDSASALWVASGLVIEDATWTAAIPIIMNDDLIVQGTDGPDGITTLTIEPGAIIRFNPGKGLYAGGGGVASKGSLVAQGTVENMITFTSNNTYPAAGDWYGLRFNTLNDSTSRLDYVIVEYAGCSGHGNITINSADPVLSHSIIRYSSSSGVYLTGTSSSNPEISCNIIENNVNGISSSGYTPPLVHGNNFYGHSGYAVNNVSPTAVDAENNWWADAQGPNTGGDRTYGDVDADPWLLAPNACFTAGANHPPNTPANPYPADEAVRAALSSGSIILQWTGGDPDLIDSVTYDLSWGTAGDALEPAAQGIIGNRHQVAGLLQGITYYWQITARDNHGLATAGPVWHFTSNGDPPDLTVSQLTTDPAGNLQPGQGVTLNATIQNIGDGPVVDPFHINCLIDGVAVGSVAIDAIVYAGNSVQAGFTWTYNGGDPTIAVTADSQSEVSETDESNNQFSAGLSAVADMTAPALIGTSPADGAYLQQVQQIACTLADSQSSVDDDAVIAGFTVRDATQTPVGGAVGEAGDTFTFTPTAGPLADGQYQVTLNAVDQYGNTQSHAFAFTVDSQPPAKPVITGGLVASGTIQARPVQNTADQFIIELTGTREAGTAVLIDGVERVGYSDTPWSVQIELQPGANTFEAKLKDRAGNIGEPEWVDIQVQTGRELNYEYDPAGRVKRIYSNQ